MLLVIGIGGCVDEISYDELRDRDGFSEKREAWCQLAVALNNQAEAYRQVYAAPDIQDETAWTNASRLSRFPYCYQRLKEIREGVRIRNGYTADKLVQMAEQNYEIALETGNVAAANKALELIAKLTGNDINKLDVTSGGKSLAHPVTEIYLGVLEPDDDQSDDQATA